MEMCRYFGMPGGCVRGERCFFAHGEEELGRARLMTGVSKQNQATNKRVTEDLSKKVFVGGLPPSVESEVLRELFEENFGPVMDAIVIGSHSGDHIQSRGFGFVTFKHEGSVTAAVQAHYVSIIGKKVEIKSAVARSVLPGVDVGSGSDLSSRVEDNSSLNLSLGSLAGESADESEASWIKVTGCQKHRARVLPLRSVLGVDSNAAKCTSPSSFQSTVLPEVQGPPPAWVTKFKQWLPGFLSEVSSRLKEGEWYPLSSLKGDFRATCGLELDHVGLGYHKLSDFIRSISELCRMKIVPVGRGPATHMVLLPLSSRALPAAQSKSSASGQLVCSSVVDAGRSYAAAACSTQKSLPSMQVAPSVVTSHRSYPGVVSSAESKNSLVSDAGESFFEDATSIVNSRDTAGDEGSFRHHHLANHMEVEDHECFAELLALLRPPESQPMEERSKNLLRDRQANQASHETDIARQSHIPATIPAATYAASLAFDHSLPRMHSRNNSLWSGYIESPTSNLEQESPQSVLPSSSTECGLKLSSTWAPFAVGAVGGETQFLAGLCPVCEQRKAIWVAVPCGHRMVCPICKNNFGLSRHNDTQCSICWRHVQRWIALH